jgi:hypothetical protein
MLWADAKATPPNSAAVVIKSLFLIERFLYFVPRAPRARLVWINKGNIGRFHPNDLFQLLWLP